jgi:hypothetical protein
MPITYQGQDVKTLGGLYGTPVNTDTLPATATSMQGAYPSLTSRSLGTTAARGIPGWLTAAIAGANVADGVTGRQALKAGGREANPVLPQNPDANLLAKIGLGAFYAYAANQIAQSHPMAARILGTSLAGIAGASALHNARSTRTP